MVLEVPETRWGDGIDAQMMMNWLGLRESGSQVSTFSIVVLAAESR